MSIASQPPTLFGYQVQKIEEARIIFHAVYLGLLNMVARRLDTEERRHIQPGCIYVWEERGQGPETTGLGIERWTDSISWGPSRVRDGILHMVTRRLDADERAALRSGCVYAWEERGPHSEITGLGIERFTEGRRWSPSRVRDEFLFYYEKYSPPPDASNLGNPSERQPPRDWDPLVKQTYSVWVETEKGRRKWHLTAYFTQATIDQLGTIDDIPRVRDVVITDGMFKSTRVIKKKPDDPKSETSRTTSSSIVRTYAPFPTPYQYQQRQDSPSSTPVLMHEPYQTSSTQNYDPAPPLSVSPPPQSTYRVNPPYTSSTRSPGPYDEPSQPTNPGTLPPPVQTLPQFQQQTPRGTGAPQNYYGSSNSSGTWSSTGVTFYHNRTQESQYAYPLSISQPTSVDSRYHNGSAPQIVPYSHYLNGTFNTLMMDDNRALSPLHIPERALHPPHIYQPVQHLSPHTPQLDELEPACALVPLNTLRQPSRILPREPCDEKTLRRLRVPGQASP
ncbi:hypothetical protein BJ165DRAFT_1525344 [Panaeolus papilionaceus]|nr:hypothetical protein BJ165DRAFT_1525344 [Panaeolus papilionaceus]